MYYILILSSVMIYFTNLTFAATDFKTFHKTSDIKQPLLQSIIPKNKEVNIVFDTKHHNVIKVIFSPYIKEDSQWESKHTNTHKAGIIKKSSWDFYKLYLDRMNKMDFNTVVNAPLETILETLTEMEEIDFK